MGKNLPAVDATCARIMEINPEKIAYLEHASMRLGAIKESNIEQRGKKIVSMRKVFKLLDYISAHKGIGLSNAV